MLAEIGRVITAWSHIEFSFDMIYLQVVVAQGGGMAKDDPRWKLMGAAFERRVRELREILPSQSFSPENLVKFDRALSQLISLRRKRDLLSHGVINPSNVSGSLENEVEAVQIMFKSWRNSKDHLVFRLTLSDLQQTSGRMTRLYNDLISLQFVLH